MKKERKHWKKNEGNHSETFFIILSERIFCEVRPRGYKTLSCSTQLSAKFQLLIKLKYRQINKFLALNLPDVVFIMLINVKMPTIVGILIFISWINFVLSRVEYDKSNITLGPDQGQHSVIRLTSNSLELIKKMDKDMGRAGQDRAGLGWAILDSNDKWFCIEQNYELDYWFNALYEACGG